MSDQESLNLEDVGAGAEEVTGEPKKAGLIPGMILKTLKYVALGLGFVILGATTTVITFNVINKGRKAGELIPTSPEYQGKPPILQFNDTIEQIRGVTSDEVPGIFTAKVSLGYSMTNKRIGFELTARNREIQNLLLVYISGKKKDELRPEHYATLQEELKQQINRIMKEGKIDKVVFLEFVIAQ